MRRSLLFVLWMMTAVSFSEAGVFQRGRVLLICHRTANADVPENTIESLEYAARMGCDVVEIDLTRTLDGKIVLHHDGMLERLSEGMGLVEQTYSEELALADAGSWMGSRFQTMRIPRFEDALRVAKERGIGLYLDLKSKGIGAKVLEEVRREGMLDRVRFGGEWEDVKQLYGEANSDAVASVNPGVSHEQIEKAHREGQFVIAEFSANHHEMDLDGMRAAVAAGADAIFVDFPRLGADAVGRPVEAKMAALAARAGSGAAMDRAEAILEMANYDGMPTRALMLQWLHDEDDRVSRAAAVALVISRPRVTEEELMLALRAEQANARKNAAWAMGRVSCKVNDALVNLLKDSDAGVLQEALLALSRCEGEVAAEKIVPLLHHPSPLVRGAAALALVRHQPVVAEKEIPALLQREEDAIAADYADFVKRGRPKLSQEEIDRIVLVYRGQMKMVQAGERLPDEEALRFLEGQAFRPVEDYSLVAGLVAGYQLWDRVEDDPAAVIRALEMSDQVVADRAEWVLVKAGPKVLPAVRAEMISGSEPARVRCIRIVAWQGDRESLPMLERMAAAGGGDSERARWAIAKIESMNFAW